MTDYENCPVCHKELPQQLEANFCPFCGVRFDPNAEEPVELVEKSKDDAEKKREKEQEPAEELGGIPWENRADLGVVQRLTQTWSESMFNPVHFFRAMPRRPGIGLAFLYGLLFKIIGAIFSVYWQQGALENLEQTLQDVPAGMREFFRMALENPLFASPEIQLLVAPFIGAFTMFLVSFIFHGAMLITGAAKNGYETTFRVVAYAESTAVFYALPVVGGWIAFIYWLVLMVIGNREAHQATTGQALSAILLPIFLCFCLISVSLFMFASALFSPGN